MRGIALFVRKLRDFSYGENEIVVKEKTIWIKTSLKNCAKHRFFQEIQKEIAEEEREVYFKYGF